MDIWNQPLPVLSMNERCEAFRPDINIPVDSPVFTEQWQHICSARFGPSRPGGHGAPLFGLSWTGDSFRYDIFRMTAGLDKGTYALRWQNGSRAGWLLEGDLYKQTVSTLATIANITDETKRWDICHFLWESIDKTRNVTANKEYQRIGKALIEKRLKIRRRGGQKYIEVVE